MHGDEPRPYRHRCRKCDEGSTGMAGAPLVEQIGTCYLTFTLVTVLEFLVFVPTKDTVIV